MSELFTDLGQAVPSESACRAHVQTLAEREMNRIKKKLTGTFMVLDESEVSKDKYINVLVGDTTEPEKTYVIYCSVVETVNQHIVTAKIDDCIKRLYTPRDRFMLLLSDAASYMTASSVALKLLYSNLFHLTCIAHLLQNCGEKVCSHYWDIDNLIARVKASTGKNKTRRQMFSDIGSLPETIITCWGYWLHTAEYYATNLVKAREIVNSFNGDGFIARRAKEAVNKVMFAQSLA